MNIPEADSCRDHVTLTDSPHVQLGGAVGVGLGLGGRAGQGGGGGGGGCSLGIAGGLGTPVRLMGVFWRGDGGGRGTGRPLRGAAAAGCGGLAGLGRGGGV